MCTENKIRARAVEFAVFKNRTRRYWSLALLCLAPLALTACENTDGKVEGHVLNGIERTTTPSKTWDFSNETDYTFNPSYIGVAGNRASLKPVASSYNSAATFATGTHSGTYWNSSTGRLTLSTSSTTNLDVRTVLPAKTTNLVGYWKFDGDLADSSGNGRTLTAQGNATTAVGGKIGRAATFDGTGDYLEFTTDFVPSKNVTFSAWIWRNTTGVLDPLLFAGPRTGCSPSAFDLRVTTGQLAQVGVGCANAIRLGAAAPSIGRTQWYHLAVTRDSLGRASIYLNGALAAGPSDVNGTETENTLQSLVVGGLFATGALSNSANGMIDELAIWNTALSDAEITALYAAQSPGPADDVYLSSTWTPRWSNLQAYWKLDGDWLDSSGNNRTLTAFGNAANNGGAKVGTNSGSFIDTTSYATRAYASATTTTISFWAKYTGTIGSVRGVFSTATSVVTNSWSIDTGGGGSCNNQFRFAGRNNAPADANYCFGRVNGEWNHFVVTYNGGTAVIYLNGQQATSFSSYYGNFLASVRVGCTRGTTSCWTGFIDEVAVWNVTLTAAEAALIYNRTKQKFGGSYTSPVIDSGVATTAWTSLVPSTALPFYKELPSTSETAYTGQDTTLMSGLVGLWHMNGTAGSVPNDGDSVPDSSASANNGLVADGTATNNIHYNSGRFAQAITFDGGNDHIDLGVTTLYNFGTTNFSGSAWINWSNCPTENRRVFGNGSTTYSNGWTMFCNGNDGEPGRIFFIIGAASVAANALSVYTTANTLNDGNWHQVGFSVNRTTKELRLFLDGKITAITKETGSCGTVTADVLDFSLCTSISPDSAARSSIGSDRGLLNWWRGAIDEVAIWNRALSETEMNLLYRRGANRIQYQVRSCADAACACKTIAVGGSTSDCSNDGTTNDLAGTDANLANWIGAAGTPATYFSEIQNNSAVDTSGNPNGSVSTGTWSADWTGAFYTAAARPSGNRYFQFRASLDSDDENASCGGATCAPELSSLEIGPTNRYYGGSPTIQNTVGFSHAGLTSFAKSDTNACTKYQFSTDGTNWKYWTGSAWSTATTQTNFSSDFSAMNFAALGGTNFYFKAFLNTNGTLSQSCDLSSVKVTY